ncbi:MAG: MFS transporter [Prevotella sp.]|nr:MFS transporter [Prevotella sp.]MBQ1700876.1 MFS transporter [Prevotella sp.]MBQ1800873.1 MFS transporter [Prevotella sp.]MBQ2131527.1 MFS transporter [Prevotella sp.]MBQ2168865.1 MFS transporter [Prevotella sp.]
MKQIQKKPWGWVPTLYFAEGLPYVAVMTISLVLYKQLGLSNTEITFYTSWLYLPWVIKPLWSPFIDLIKTKRWWIVTMELLIGAAFGGVAFMIPTSLWLQGTLFFFWVMAFASATHDIAADGFYMLGLDTHQQAWFVGIRSTFYRLATIFGQGILVMIAGNLQVIYRNSISYSWSLMFYGVTGIFIALWLWHHYALPVPAEDAARNDVNVQTIWKEFVNTIKSFFKKPQVTVGILFMLLYRMPEGLLAKVSALFLIDAAHNGGMGLSPQEYGLVQGTVGVIGLTLGGILGGICAGKDGLKKWLWPMVCAITLPDIVYVYLSYALQSNLVVINVCVFIEQFGYGFGFTAYMLYLIYYSRGQFKTSHYALCTAFMALSMMIPGLFAGALQEMVGYRMFFIIVMMCCAITFVVTSFLKIDPEFGKKEKDS